MKRLLSKTVVSVTGDFTVKKMWFAFLNWFDEVSRDLESIY